MVTFVLDASSILRHLDDEAGASRVGEIFRDCFAGRNRAVISSVQWGEIACVVHKRYGSSTSVNATLTNLLNVGIEVVAASPQRAVRSGIIRAKSKIPFADCFAIELAGDSPDHLLITADFDMKPAEDEVRIEFLPAKSKLN